jgi:hypothetical protein
MKQDLGKRLSFRSFQRCKDGVGRKKEERASSLG